MLIFIGYLSINPYKNLNKMLFLETHVKKLCCFFNRSIYTIADVVSRFSSVDVLRSHSVLEDALIKNHK